MNKPFYRSPHNKVRLKTDSALVMENVALSRPTLDILKKISQERGIPVSRLIAQAVDNELDAPYPFNYPCDEPSVEYDEIPYMNEAQKIFTFLQKYPRGMDRETLMLCRREIGIENRELFMLGLRRLLKTQLVEEFFPRKTVFRYPVEYRRIRPVKDDPRDLKKKRYGQTKEEEEGDDE